MSLANFHDVSFPLPLALAATGGPERRVEVVPLASGGEVRNAVWAGSRRRWDVGSVVTRSETLQEVIAFFEARGGRLHGFRFRDILDARSSPQGVSPSPLDQHIGTGDGIQTAFELTKAYGDYKRRIWKPVAGSVSVAVDGETAEVSVDAATGLVTFGSPPMPGAAITAGYLFDCAARFDTDQIEVSLEAFSAGRVLRVPLIELVG